MLRQILMLSNHEIIYQINFGNALDHGNINYIIEEIEDELSSSLSEPAGSYNYFKNKISYLVENEKNFLLIFISDLTDEFDQIKAQMTVLKNEVLNLFSEFTLDELDSSMLKVLEPRLYKIHRSLKPKISLVGFSGVGKTTITKLIKAEKIPVEHIPTITGDISTIKFGNLNFNLWDFAGQDQFNFLWGKFIRGSDAVLLITDSTSRNIEKSKSFLTLIEEEAPNAHCAVIGNKQDLPNAIKVVKIEEILGLKTYPLIAIDPNNREKMIRIIADILEIDADISPLLKPLLKRDQLIEEAEKALRKNEFEKVAQLFETIGELCQKIGDYSLSMEFFYKSERIKKFTN